jgi:hypothetical protein
LQRVLKVFASHADNIRKVTAFSQQDMLMDFYTTELAVPQLQIMLLLPAGTVTLLPGRIKLALLVKYFLAAYWGYILNVDLFLSIGSIDTLTAIYFG